MATPDHEFLNWLADRLVNVYGESPNVDFVLSLRQRANRTTVEEIRSLVVPGATGINAWINQEIEKANGNREGWTLSHEDAADIARRACLAVIADKETLIANLRRAGYTVTPP